MPKAPVPQPIAEFLAKPNPAVIATVKPDGQPVSVPTWYMYEDGRILVNMQDSRKRLDYMRANPLVAVSVLEVPNWGTHVSVQGRIAEISDDPDLSVIDKVAAHYGVAHYPIRDRKRVSAWIEIDQWHSWGSLADVG
ncbi:MAG TPA: PPOX class F420-dependent oxidoreductase [Actinocrinis sp.]